MSEAPVLRRVARWLVPTAPETLRVEVQRRQLARIRAHVPMVYMIAILNALILMAVFAHNDFDPRTYVWMGALVVLAVVRTVMWIRSKHSELPPAAVSVMLARSAWIATGTLLVCGTFTSWTFVAGTFAHTTLIPISLAFGSMSIAHCFATLRPSAVAALLLGIVPSALAMLLVGDFDARVLGLSMLSVAVLMIHFVAIQYDQLVTEVKLQQEVHDLANTDALTDLPNRRAVVARIESELARGSDASFGVALLDLDGFKGINDRLGHLAGDALLRVVAERLTRAAGPADTVARLGGDEFIVVLGSVGSAQELTARVDAILSVLCQPTQLGAATVGVDASLGAAFAPRDGTTTAALLAAADEALYAVKRARAAPRTAPGEAPGSEERRRHRA